MKSKMYLVLILAVAVGLCLVSCGAGKKAAATTAIKTAEDAYNAVKADLVKYLPEDAQGVEDAINGAKASLEEKKFDAAIEAVKAIPDKIAELTVAAAAKKDELTKSWEEMSGAMPGMLETIKTKLDALSASRKLPVNLDKAALENAKGGYETATAMWNEAQTAFSGGDVVDAMAKAKTVQEKAMEIMTAIGIPLPGAASK